MNEALDEIQWKLPEFIQERGLHTGNVLEYFGLSPFYDRTSNNQTVIMQFQHQQVQIPQGMTFYQYLQSKLAWMNGVEYAIAYTREPDFWVIRKQRRTLGEKKITDNNNNDPPPSRTEPLEDYYVIGANIYQAPKIFDIISSRLLASVLAMKNSMELIHDMTKFHLLDGVHSYNNKRQLQVGSGALGLLAPGTLAPNKTLGAALGAATVALTPQISGGTPAAIASVAGTNNPLSALAGISTPSAIEITASAFDNLLNNVVQLSNLGTAGAGASRISFNGSSGATTSAGDSPTEASTTSIYLDDIPLYGKGSTVEMLGLTVNPEVKQHE